MVERQADPTDRRVKAIAATEQGLHLREGLTQRLRSDAGPAKALTQPQLHRLLTLALS